MTSHAPFRAVSDRIHGILSRAAKEIAGEVAMKCDFTATELSNCARKNWDPYRMDKIATKCKRSSAKEFDVILKQRERKWAATKLEQGRRLTSSRATALVSFCILPFHFPESKLMVIA